MKEIPVTGHRAQYDWRAAAYLQVCYLLASLFRNGLCVSLKACVPEVSMHASVVACQELFSHHFSDRYIRSVSTPVALPVLTSLTRIPSFAAGRVLGTISGVPIASIPNLLAEFFALSRSNSSYRRRFSATAHRRLPPELRRPTTNQTTRPKRMPSPVPSPRRRLRSASTSLH